MKKIWHPNGMPEQLQIELNIKNIKIFNYNYSQLFPFKVFKSQYTDKENGILIHAKLYIIDDKIAYLGSLNFTYSGVKGNYESRLKTVDKNVINKLIEEFCSLMNSNHPQKDIQLWGKELYPEPLNESL